MKNKINNLKQLAKNIKVLYVEDNIDTQTHVKEQLELFFENITTAKDGFEGIEKFEKDEFDLIITDINMPKLSGIKMIEKIKEKNKKVKTILLTAYNTNNYLKDALNTGIDGYLLKPIEFNQFITEFTRITKIINTEKELDEYKNFLERKLDEQYKEIEEQQEIIIHNSKLAAMGEMIDIIAHQWKQPLNSIALRTNFLKINIEDGINITDEQIIECSDKVNEQIVYLTDTLNHFRNFFIVEENIKLTKLIDTLDTIKILLKDNIIKNNISLNFDVKDDIYLNCVDNDLKNIFINLINNSRDAFLENNIINRKIDINAKKEDNSIIIEVIDNAGGIKEELIKNIFKANFTTKKHIGGTGIGLYMLKLIADKYKIRIDVQNYNGGLKFTLEVPNIIIK